MHDTLSAASAMFLIALVAVLLASFYFLDRLIRHEYAFHRDQWERDGRPNGFFFRPPELRWFRSGFAFQRCALGWPLYTPEWVREDPTARTLHRRMRVCVLIWNLGFISFVLFMIPHLIATRCI
ncbi:MAG: hypothetical protein JO354_09515 [Verrucomicrobia bacterium]|nr:hypothetical protein [Verrucomicrobiota bacterium]